MHGDNSVKSIILSGVNYDMRLNSCIGNNNLKIIVKYLFVECIIYVSIPVC
jgi:hypothetical protein